jgi:UDP-3-O-[3-hydroxymyristoyl] glucosamine N-acyltransferase
MEFTVEQLAGMLEGKVVGDGSLKIRNLKKIQDGAEGDVSFLSNPKYEKYAYSTQATALIVNEAFSPKPTVNASLIVVKDPYLSFTILLEEYHKFIQFQKTGVEEPSFMDPSSTIGSEAYRGAFSYIGAKTTIGDNVKIYPQAYIGDHVTVGDNTIIYPGVKIYPNTVIGKNCVLHAGVVLGSAGFGYAPLEDGSYRNIPQLGNVTLGNFVHIGANSTLDGATMQGDSTSVDDGSKIDNLVQLGHNVAIGKHTVIAAQTGVSGSTKIGDFCVVGGQVGFAGHIEIANKTSIGAQSGVLKSTKEGEKLFGSFAIDARSYISSYAVFKKLPELNRRLKELEEKILNLPTI